MKDLQSHGDIWIWKGWMNKAERMREEAEKKEKP